MTAGISSSSGAAPSGAALSLRPYQQEAVQSAFDALRDKRSALVVMATGLGKTVVFAEIIRRAQASGRTWRTLVLAHREELIHQAARTVERIAKCDVDIEMGDLRAEDTLTRRAPVVVSSIQTQVAGRGDYRRMHRFKPEQFGLVIVDEAHHATSESYKAVLAHYRQNPNCRVIGFTATPDRSDEQALGQVFDCCPFQYGIRDGIADGWLVPIKQRIVHVGALDFSSCRTTAGDLNGADLDAVMQYEETLHGMVFPTIELAGDRRCIVFAASVAHAHRIAEIINRHKAGSAVAVDASTPRDERRSLFAGFAEGRYQFLVNVGVATEGWDDAALDGRGVQLVAMMRPTKSRALYCQMVGRGTRPLPRTVDGIDGADARREAIAASVKPAVTVLDYCGNAGRHKLVHCVDALAGNDSAATERAERAVMADAEEADVDVLDALNQAEVRERIEREAKQRKGFVVRAGYTTQEIDPFSLIDLAPDRQAAWEKGIPASDKQLECLRRMRVAIPDLLTRAEAKRLIDAAIATPTPKQQAVLIRNGFDPSDFDRKSASRVIDAIFARENRRNG
jgi:superfamily II DNA or RNA helicase